MVTQLLKISVLPKVSDNEIAKIKLSLRTEDDDAVIIHYDKVWAGSAPDELNLQFSTAGPAGTAYNPDTNTFVVATNLTAYKRWGVVSTYYIQYAVDPVIRAGQHTYTYTSGLLNYDQATFAL